MGIIQKVGNFLGVNKFAQSVSDAGRVITGSVKKDIETQAKSDIALQKLTYVMKNEKDPEKKQQLKNLIQSHLNNKGYSATEISPALNYKNREILGSAANVALNTLTPGAFKGGKAAILGKNAALGAGFGAASGLEKGRTAGGVVGSATGGAIIGGSIGAVGLMAKAAKNYLGKTIPEWMMNKAVKPALDDLKKNIKYGGDTLGKELLDEGVKGGPKKLLEIADNKTTELEKRLQDILTSPELSQVSITKDKLKQYITDLVETKSGIPGMSGDVKKIISIFDSLPDKMSLLEANTMKRRIYNELTSTAYKLDAKLRVKSSALKQIAKGLKTEIENEVGGNIVKDINKKLSIYGRLENSIVDQLAREIKNNDLNLTDAILIAGGETGWLALLRHLGQGAETTAAQGLKKIENFGTGAIGGAIKNTLRKGAFNIQ